MVGKRTITRFGMNGYLIFVIGSARSFFLDEAFHPANTSAKLDTGSHPVIKPLSYTATRVLFIQLPAKVSCNLTVLCMLKGLLCAPVILSEYDNHFSVQKRKKKSTRLVQEHNWSLTRTSIIFTKYLFLQSLRDNPVDYKVRNIGKNFEYCTLPWGTI